MSFTAPRIRYTTGTLTAESVMWGQKLADAVGNGAARAAVVEGNGRERMQRIEQQRRQNSDKAELSRLSPGAGVKRLTDDEVAALNRNVKRAIGDDDDGQATGRLNTPALLDSVRRSEERRREREQKQSR
jgi:hypothetical protein